MNQPANNTLVSILAIERTVRTMFQKRAGCSALQASLLIALDDAGGSLDETALAGAATGTDRATVGLGLKALRTSGWIVAGPREPKTVILTEFGRAQAQTCRRLSDRLDALVADAEAEGALGRILLDLDDLANFRRAA